MPAQFLRQGGEERRQPLDQGRRLLDQAARQRRDLEDQRARLGAEAFQAGHDELAGGDGGVEEVRIGHLPSPLLVAHHGVADQGRRLHDEAEVVRHLLRVALVLDRRDRRIERPVEADRAQQRDLGIGGQALLAERVLRMDAVVDEAAPAGKEPRRRAEPDVARQRRRLQQRRIPGRPDLSRRGAALEAAARIVRTGRAAGSNLLHLRDARQAADGVAQAGRDRIGAGQGHLGLASSGIGTTSVTRPRPRLPSSALRNGLERRRDRTARCADRRRRWRPHPRASRPSAPSASPARRPAARRPRPASPGPASRRLRLLPSSSLKTVSSKAPD